MSATTSTPIDFSKPMVDNVKIPGAGKMAGKTLSCFVSAELMKNQQVASPVDATGRTIVLQDSNGKPMMVSIGTDQKLWLLRYDESSHSGWEAVDLGAGFTGYGGAAAFDAAQDGQGRISLAFALTRNGATGTDVFTAVLLSDDPSKTDWSKLASVASKVDHIDPAFVADTIEVGVTDDGDPPLIVVSGAIGSQEYYYRINAAGQPAQELEFPENVAGNLKALQGISLGYVRGLKGVFFLYQQGQSQTLECSVTGPEIGRATIDFSPGSGGIAPDIRYNCMATAPGSATVSPISSDIFVGTDKGIYVIRKADPNSFEKVTDQLTDVHEIIVRQDDESVSIWALSSPSTVHYIRGTRGQAGAWAPPILFSTDAVHLAPIRNRTMRGNELFLVDQTSSVVHYWQDPASTQWQQRTIKTKGSNFLIDFSSYTTRIGLEDQDGDPLFNEPLKVTASEWTYVTANGRTYSLDKDNAAVIPTDVTGALTIVSMASSISTPILHVEGDSFSKTLNIYPNGKVLKGLQGITTGDDLKAAQGQDGKPVFTNSYSEGTWEGVADNVHQLNTASSQLQTGVQPTGGAVFVSVEDLSVKHDGKLALGHLPADFAVGMQRVNGAWQPHPNIKAAMSMRLGGVASSLEALPGDLLQDIGNVFEDGIRKAEEGLVTLEDGATFVIQKVEQAGEDVLQFTLTVADKAINVVLKTLDSVLRVVSWILKQIGAAILEILKWLGFLFIWIEIWEAHKVIARMVKAGLNYAEQWADTGLEVARAHIDQVLGTLQQDIKSVTLPAAQAQRGPWSDAGAARAARPMNSLRSPQANFITHHLLHGGLAGGAAAVTSAGDPLVEAFDILSSTSIKLSTAFQNDLQDVANLVQGKGATYADVLKLAGDLADTALEPLQELLDGLFTLVEQLLGGNVNTLEGDVDIPFLGTLFKFVTELLGDEEDLTYINVAALLVATPAVIVGKIETGKAPLVDEGSELGSSDLFTTLFGSPASVPMPAQRIAPAAPRMASAPGLSRALATAGKDKGSWPDAYVTTAALYSEIGGFVGGIAALEMVACTFMMGVVAGEIIESNPTPGGAPARRGFAPSKLAIVLVVLGVMKLACTAPLLREKQSLISYVPKAAGFGLACLQTIANFLVCALAPKPFTINGWLLAGFDGLILGAATFADTFELVAEPDWQDGMALTVDVLGNLCGVAEGLGQGGEGYTAEALMDPAQTVEVLLYYGGLTGRAAAAYADIGADLATMIESTHEIKHQVVNLAG
jgi:hypothetical protein